MLLGISKIGLRASQPLEQCVQKTDCEWTKLDDSTC